MEVADRAEGSLTMTEEQRVADLVRQVWAGERTYQSLIEEKKAIEAKGMPRFGEEYLTEETLQEAISEEDWQQWNALFAAMLELRDSLYA